MFEQYLIHISADPLLKICILTMMVFFLYDLVGLIARVLRNPKIPHHDFKSTIVSLGIFGTFLGILSGLYNFDSSNITQSVPGLLNGLKFAFATSVFGMFLSLILSVLHKVFGSAEDEITLLVGIEDKMDRMDRRLVTLSKTIESPAELVNQFSEMKTFLTDRLSKIHTSLDDALEKLAAGATEEVIQALENVIQEFNQNLQEQFGENFKELNDACRKLLDWQNNYRDHVDSMEEYLSQIHESLETSAEKAKELTEMNEETKEVCQEVAGLIKTYDIQIKTLETHLKSCKELGEEAKEFVSETRTALALATENMDSFSDTIQDSVRQQSESLTELTKGIEEQLPKSLGELDEILTKLTNQFADDYRSLFEFITKK